MPLAALMARLARRGHMGSPGPRKARSGPRGASGGRHGRCPRRKPWRSRRHRCAGDPHASGRMLPSVGRAEVSQLRAAISRRVAEGTAVGGEVMVVGSGVIGLVIRCNGAHCRCFRWVDGANRHRIWQHGGSVDPRTAVGEGRRRTATKGGRKAGRGRTDVASLPGVFFRGSGGQVTHHRCSSWSRATGGADSRTLADSRGLSPPPPWGVRSPSLADSDSRGVWGDSARA